MFYTGKLYILQKFIHILLLENSGQRSKALNLANNKVFKYCRVSE